MEESFFDPCSDAYQRGLDHLAGGRPEESIDHFTRAVQLDPQYVNAYLARAFAWLETGQPEQAIADCSAAIRLSPELSQAFRLRASAYRGLGEDAKADADLARAGQLAATPAQRLTVSELPGERM